MKIMVLSSHTHSLFWFRLDMMKEFINGGNEIVATGSEDEAMWKDQFEEHGIRYKKIPVDRCGMSPKKDVKTLVALIKLIKSEKPDKIFAYQAKTVIYGSIAAKICGVKDVYLLFAGLGSIFRGNGYKNRIIKTIIFSEYKVACAFAKALIFQNCDDMLQFIKKVAVKREKCQLINGSGVNIEHFSKVDLPKGMSFLFIGRLLKDKGVIEYLKACRILKNKYPAIRCLLVGPFDSNPSALNENDLKPYIDDQIIEYFGQQKDVRPFIEMCNVYVLPSYHEGTPKTVLEAMAMGRPIITSDAPGCRETVINNRNGFLVKVQDVDDLVEKMELFVKNKELIHQFGEVSRNIAEDRFDVNKVNQTILEIMELV